MAGGPAADQAQVLVIVEFRRSVFTGETCACAAVMVDGTVQGSISRRLAAVLVGLRGDTEDLPLLLEVRETDFDTACGLGGMPEPGARVDELQYWARTLDESMFGTDPSDEPVST